MAYIKLEDLQKIPIRIDHYDKENGNEDFVLGIETAIEYAEHLPTADVEEVKHGEWFLLDECANEGVYCSVCHKKIYRTEYANQKIKSKYCPNCGADMRGVKDE